MNELEFLASTQLHYEIDHSMARYCTYRVGGPAKYFVSIDSVDDLVQAKAFAERFSLPTLMIGKGSNLLVADNGFEGLCIQLGKAFDFVEIDGQVVTVGAITFLPIVARQTAAAGLTGFEWAVGVPGSLGGAVRMNAGCHGSDMAANLIDVHLFDFSDGALHTLSAAELKLGYRSSSIKQTQLVLSARLRLERGEAEVAKQEISEIVQWRRSHQPGGANAGSVFANPEGTHSAKLIDECGLKGFTMGTASVSEKHANFIQATAEGSADDVFRLIEHIKRVVLAETGYELRVENRLIGFD